MSYSVIDIIEQLRWTTEQSEIRNGLSDIQGTVDVVVVKLKDAFEDASPAAAKAIALSLALLMSQQDFHKWLRDSDENEL